MAKPHEFKVSKKGVEPVTVTILRPENLQDEAWNKLVKESEKDEAINDLAFQNLVIKVQAGARNFLDQGQEKVQAYVDQYQYGARVGGGFTRPALGPSQIAQGGFTEEQLAALRAAGVRILDEDPSENEEETEEMDEELVEA